MEWVLISVLPVAVFTAVACILEGWEGAAMGVVVTVIWEMIVWLFVHDVFSDGYKDWLKDGRPGDHAWFEWAWCQECWKEMKDRYDPATYCKMRLPRFKKFFAVNPDRYKLSWGYAVCDDGRPQDLIILFPRRDLFGYYRFRRNWVQSRRLVDVTGYVKSDIEAAHKEVSRQVDEARRMMGEASKGLVAPWDSTFGGSGKNDFQ